MKIKKAWINVAGAAALTVGVGAVGTNAIYDYNQSKAHQKPHFTQASNGPSCDDSCVQAIEALFRLAYDISIRYYEFKLAECRSKAMNNGFEWGGNLKSCEKQAGRAAFNLFGYIFGGGGLIILGVANAGWLAEKGRNTKTRLLRFIGRRPEEPLADGAKPDAIKPLKRNLKL